MFSLSKENKRFKVKWKGNSAILEPGQVRLQAMRVGTREESLSIPETLWTAVVVENFIVKNLRYKIHLFTKCTTPCLYIAPSITNLLVQKITEVKKNLFIFKKIWKSPDLEKIPGKGIESMIWLKTYHKVLQNHQDESNSSKMQMI